MSVDIQKYYIVSDEVIARVIESETVIVPLISGVGDLSAEMFSLNETGTMVWGKLDGTISLGDVILKISKDFNTPSHQIREDIIELIVVLLKKGLIFEVQHEK